MTLIVDTDDVLDLFGVDDRDIYAKGTIEDAIYDGTLKPTEPERKTGRWLVNDDFYETAMCSHCGFDTEELYTFIASNYNYCPNCGAYMGGK